MPNNRIFVVRAKQELKSKVEKREPEVDIKLGQDKDHIEDLEEFKFTENKKTSESSYDDSKLYRDLRILFLILRTFGMFFKRQKQNGRVTCDRWAWYSVAIVIIQFMCLVRSLSVFSLQDDFNAILFFKLQIALWTVENMVKLVAMVYASYSQQHLLRFFQSWTEICDNKPLSKGLRIVRNMSLMISGNFVFVNSLGIVLSLLFVPELDDLYIKLSWPDASHATLIQKHIYEWVFLFCSFLSSGLSVFSVSLLVILTSALTEELYDVTKQLTQAINKDGDFDNDLESVRLRHQGLCRLTSTLDDVFMVVVAVVYMANIPMSCVILYNAIYHQHTVALTLFNIFWMVSLLFHMSVVSVVCARINVAAHQPLEELYNVSAEQLQNQQIQLIMFMNRLSGGDIGMTAIKMFVINRPTILTVIGMLITYFVLLVQFKTPAVAVCNYGINGTHS